MRYVMALIFVWAFGIASAADPSGDNLDQEVFWVVKKNCSMCHDDRGDGAAEGVADLLDLESLAGYLDPSAEDYLNDLVLGDKARMPKATFDTVSWNGPLSTSDKQTLRKWIDRGGPSEAYLAQQESTDRPVTSLAAVESMIAADIRTLSRSDQQFARYLTLASLANDRSVSEDDLAVARAAIAKTLNSLSFSADVLGLDTSNATNRLFAIDDGRTVFRFDLRDIGWTAGKWDLIAGHSPFGLSGVSNAEQALRHSTSSSRPVLRADWFIFAALQPPLYHKLLELPDSLSALEHLLGVKREDAIRARRVARSGMIRSKVSVNNRLLERIPMTTRSGAYHISYDFASNDGDQNFRDFPFGPVGVIETNKAFVHDGGEVIWNLPNGFQAYLLVQADGKRLDIAPSAIVEDRSMPGSRIINGISCLACHFQGMKPERNSPRLASLDIVRDAVLGNNVRFSRDEQELVRDLHPAHQVFASLLEQDRERFLDALNRAGIPQIGAVEPARFLFDQFKRDLNVNRLAAELGLSVEQLQTAMYRESETRQILAAAERGVLKRQEWISLYGRAARLAGLGEAIAARPLVYPYFGQEVGAFDFNDQVEETAAAAVGQTGVDLIDSENRDGRLQIKLWTEDERLSFRDGDAIRVRVQANEDCFLTLLSIDPLGDITLLVPNAFHGDFPIVAGRVTTIPTEQMPFEFFAQPPHGRTIIKAIATKKPLGLKDVNRQRLQRDTVASLGRAKGIGVGKKRDRPTSTAPVMDQLAVQRVEQQFRASEWATSNVTVTTLPSSP